MSNNNKKPSFEGPFTSNKTKHLDKFQQALLAAIANVQYNGEIDGHQEADINKLLTQFGVYTKDFSLMTRDEKDGTLRQLLNAMPHNILDNIYTTGHRDPYRILLAFHTPPQYIRINTNEYRPKYKKLSHTNRFKPYGGSRRRTKRSKRSKRSTRRR
jgi:hypothetical protein